MDMEKDIGTFIQLLNDATKEIEDQYFQLPIDGADSVYRERVYAYELYHQLRKIWGCKQHVSESLR